MGEWTKEGEFRPVTAEDLAVQERAQSMQTLHQVPVLQQSDNRHEYMYFALFDGTGQDLNDPEHLPTNVGLLAKQAELLARNPSNRIGSAYVEGIGTQKNFVSEWIDKGTAYTWDEKLEQGYVELARQTKQWKEQDPEAQVRVVGVGYSRGAVLSAGLARMVDKYGIADPEGLSFGRDANGNIAVQSDRPPLMAPGTVAQALGLYDPVATSFPRGYDARTPPSSISALALAARDEDRVDFAHQAILQPGLSDDRRSANLLVPGGHSNVGGGNRDVGLEAMSFNTMADYLNALRDRPLFEYRPLPEDPSQYTVFQARGPSAFRGMDQDALRDVRTELANCKVVDPCRDREPMDQALAAQFEYRAVRVGAPLPTLRGLGQEAERSQASPLAPDLPRSPADRTHPDNGLFEKLRDGVRTLDKQAGKDWNDDSDRLTAAAFGMAKGGGFTERDELRLAFNTPTASMAGGEVLHLSREGRDASVDPAANRAWMRTPDALSMPVDERYAQVEAATRAQTEAQLREQQQQVETQTRSGPVMMG